MSGEAIQAATVVDGMSDAEYHSHPALSSSGARALLPPSCPALFRYQREHPRFSAAFDLGHAAHALVLGAGQEIEVIDAEDWRSKAAKESRDLARLEGRTPLLGHEHDQVVAMAAQLRTNPIAAALLDPDAGAPEQSIFWQAGGTDLRARLDWLPETDGGRLIVADYKTCVSAAPAAITKSVANYGYHVQHAWYVAGVQALALAQDVAMVFIFQEKTAPYLVTVVELDPEAQRLGGVLADHAIATFAHCTATDTWPGYSDDVEPISLPIWATIAIEESA